MSLEKFKLFYNSTVGTDDEVKSFLFASDGQALTHSSGALDVNIAASDIAISVAESDVYLEDAAHADGDKGAFMLGVRRDARSSGVSASGDYASLNLNAMGELWTKDADVLAKLESGVVISDGGSSLPPYNLAVGTGEAYATLDAAIAAATNGQTILVRSGTYLVSTAIAVNKEVKIIGESRTGVIFETAGGSSDPVNIFNVTANNVAIAQMTIKHKKSSNTSVEAAVLASGGGFPQTRISGFLLASCTIEYMEMGLSVRAENWCARDCTFTYATGAASNTNRCIVIYGTKGNSFIKDNLLKNDVLSSTAFRPFYLTSTTGTNPNETVEGKLVIEGNTHVGTLAQFFNQDNGQSAGAGTFELQIKNNVTAETNLFAGFGAYAANAGDMFSSITLQNNTISNLHAVDGGKGMFGVYGTAAFRSTSLVLHASGNVFGQTVFRSGWSSVDTELVGKETAVPAFTVTKDAIIPASGTAPSVLLSTPGNSITVDAVDFDIRNLVFATDKVDVSGSSVSISGTVAVSATDLDLRDLAFATDKVDVSGSSVSISSGSLTVSATDLDIRDLAFATDKVDVSGSSVSISSGSLTVSATDLDIRDLAFATDKVDVSGSAVTISSGSVTVSATDLDVRDLSHATDSVTARLQDGSGTALESLGGNLSVADSVLLDSLSAPSVSTTEVAVTAVSAQKKLTIQNLSNENIYLGPTGVSTTSGLLIPKQSSQEIALAGTVYLIAGASLPANSVRIAHWKAT